MKWDYNCWTGNDINDVPELAGRIVRMPWGSGEYRYQAEYWGEYPTLRGMRRETLEQAMKDLRRLHAARVA